MVEQWGGVDALVCNAGAPVIRQPAADVDWPVLEHKVMGELQSVWLLARETFSLLKRTQGCCVFVSSGLAERPQPGFLAHGVAKSAINSLIRYLAMEWGEFGIRVNGVAPGLVLTDASNDLAAQASTLAQSLPLRRLATADDVGGVVTYLVSPHAAGLTGAILPVAGGGHLGGVAPV